MHTTQGSRSACKAGTQQSAQRPPPLQEATTQAAVAPGAPRPAPNPAHHTLTVLRALQQRQALPSVLGAEHRGRQQRRWRLLQQWVQAGAGAAHLAVHHHHKVRGSRAAGQGAGEAGGTRCSHGRALEDSMGGGMEQHTSEPFIGSSSSSGSSSSCCLPTMAGACPSNRRASLPEGAAGAHPPKRLPRPMPIVMKKSKLSRCRGGASKHSEYRSIGQQLGSLASPKCRLRLERRAGMGQQSRGACRPALGHPGRRHSTSTQLAGSAAVPQIACKHPSTPLHPTCTGSFSKYE